MSGGSGCDTISVETGWEKERSERGKRKGIESNVSPTRGDGKV